MFFYFVSQPQFAQGLEELPTVGGGFLP